MKNVLPKGCYVVLHIGAGPGVGNTSQLIVTDANKRFELSSDTWVERLDEQLAKRIQQACEPPHFNIGKLAHDRHLYAFVKTVPDVESRRYEGLNELLAVTTLSRFIHPTTVGTRYCARVFHYGLPDSAIQAIQFGGLSPDVYISSGINDWLSVDHGEQLRSLMPYVFTKQMHRRIHRAYWNHDYAQHTFFLDMRWPLVVSGLEALINTDKVNVTRQFVERVFQLAKLERINLIKKEVRVAYDLRSKLVHTESFLGGLEKVLPQSKHRALYEKLEAVLRLTVQRCLLDEDFANHFRDATAVRAKWPIKLSVWQKIVAFLFAKIPGLRA